MVSSLSKKLSIFPAIESSLYVDEDEDERIFWKHDHLVSWRGTRWGPDNSSWKREGRIFVEIPSIYIFHLLCPCSSAILHC